VDWTFVFPSQSFARCSNNHHSHHTSKRAIAPLTMKTISRMLGRIQDQAQVRPLRFETFIFLSLPSSLRRCQHPSERRHSMGRKWHARIRITMGRARGTKEDTSGCSLGQPGSSTSDRSFPRLQLGPKDRQEACALGRQVQQWERTMGSAAYRPMKISLRTHSFLPPLASPGTHIFHLQSSRCIIRSLASQTDSTQAVFIPSHPCTYYRSIVWRSSAPLESFWPVWCQPPSVLPR
jgi:hypothetical protein